MNWADKRVLVTGSSGFLGKYVVEELKNRGVQNLQLPNSNEFDFVFSLTVLCDTCFL